MAGSGVEVLCVWCNKSKPVDGKILSCLHVACLSCISDVVTFEGKVECVLCSQVTEAPAGGNLSHVLEDSQPLLGFSQEASADHDETVTGSGDNQKCDFCLDDAVRDASRQCNSCEMLLCEGCATVHGKQRAFRGHIVVALSGDRDRPRPGVLSVRCAALDLCCLHAKMALNMYCVECDKVMCEKCRDTGHANHSVLSCADWAEETRRDLREVLQQHPVPGAHSASAVAQAPPHASTDGNATLSLAADVRGELERQVAVVEAQAEASSKTVVAEFDAMEVMLKEKREESLGAIDQERWKQHKVLEKRSWVANAAEAHYRSVLALGRAVLSPDISDITLARLGRAIPSHLESTAATLRKVKEESSSSKRLQPIVEVIDGCAEVRRSMSALRVSWERTACASQSKIIFPDVIVRGNTSEISVQLYSPDGRALHTHPGYNNLWPKIVSPSSSEVAVTMTTLEEKGKPAQVRIAISPSETGQHTLLLSSGNGASQTATFDVLPASVFSPAMCSSKILLSLDGRTAAYAAEDFFSNCIVGAEGYEIGRNSWRLRVGNSSGFIGDYTAVGVSSLPLASDNFDHFSRSTFYGWCPKGAISLYSMPQAAATSEWQDPEELVLTLDCDEKTLEIYIPRLNERKTLTDISTGRGKLHLYCHLSWARCMVQILNND